MIKLTALAAKEITKLADEQIKEKDFILRVGVKGGGCAGLEYTLDLTTADAITDSDEVFEEEGIKVVCDPKSYLYLKGTTIDFKNELMKKGFSFDNPNSTGCCGCEKSFSCG